MKLHRSNSGMVRIAHDWWVVALMPHEAEDLFDKLGMLMMEVTDEELDALLSREIGGEG